MNIMIRNAVNGRVTCNSSAELRRDARGLAKNAQKKLVDFWVEAIDGQGSPTLVAQCQGADGMCVNIHQAI